MFEYRSDIAIVHGAFLYIQNHMLSNTEAVKCILNVLSDSSIIENELQLKRIHAALFVSLIRPFGIKDDAFGAINDLFSNCNWYIYFELMKKALWRTHYLECCCQIDKTTLEIVMIKTLEHIRELPEENNTYLISCIIQANLKCSFPDEFQDILIESVVLFEVNCNPSVNCNDLESVIETISALSKHIINTISIEKNPTNEQINLSLHKWSNLLSILNAKLGKVPSINFQQHKCLSFFALLRYICLMDNENILHSKEVLNFFNIKAMLLKNDSFCLEKLDILQDYTVVSELLEELKNENIFGFEVEFSKKVTFQLTKRLLKLCLDCKDKLLVRKLSKAFLQVSLLPLNGTSDKEKLNLVIDEVGIQAGPLKEDNYNEKLVIFLNQSVESDYEKGLLQLGLQSPLQTVTSIFQQSVENSGQIAVMVKMLNFLSPICQYQSNNEQNDVLITLFHSAVENANTFSVKQKQNLIKCIQLLSKDFPNGVLNLPKLFKSICKMLHPYISNNIVELLLDIIIQILQMERDVKLNMFEITLNPLEVIVCHFLKLADYCIENGLISLRQRIIKLLSLIKELCSNEEICLSKHNQNWLRLQLKDSHELVQLEAEKFFNYGALNNSCTIYALLLRTCIHGASTEIRLEKVDRAALVLALAKILPYTTEEESIQIMDYLINMEPVFMENENAINKMHNTTISAMQIYIDALILIALCKTDVIKWSYILTSLGYVIKSCIRENITILFSEMCYLSNYLPDSRKVSDCILNIMLQIDGAYQGYANEAQYKISSKGCIQAISSKYLKSVLLETLC